MPVYSVDMTFDEPTGAHCEVQAGSPDEASSIVTNMLAEAGAKNVAIISVELIRDDNAQNLFLKSLN